MAFRNQTAGSAPFYLAILMIGLTLGACNNWSKARVTETKQRGDVIRKALQQYHDGQGVYPNDLQVLIPKYLPKLLPPTVGNGTWTYETFAKGQAYRMSAGIRGKWEPLLQADQNPGWTYDTK
jgi:hypothetical protein